ncbi:MAG: DUF5698 domain-containing protein [Melioribacteraceae bacterium]|nr:DUF5698 domain-containing protein [Melioribacteraceae bacterium]MCF8412088.1 DUF5698 domain-containing protein [Melioribacteraceae bacterium]MCF8432338.1 DUF5698 domain-containing protein [Melioribacteraceae bacterium]
MIEALSGAVLIMVLRIFDVTLGTLRTILVVQAKKYHAAITGFFEVLIWIYAMKYIMQHMDNTYNMFGYAIGFGLGNLLGITLEGKIGIGYIQLNIISRKFAKEITVKLRESKYAVTIIPAMGGYGNIDVLVAIISRKQSNQVIKLIEGIDKDCFISVQHSRPYRGYVHGSRK